MIATTRTAAELHSSSLFYRDALSGACSLLGPLMR
jgi:hypothetical protein